jgi:acyl carrier protein
MSDNNVYNTITSTLSELLGYESVSKDDQLQNDLQVDSLMLVLIITDVCSKIGLDIYKIDERDVASLVTIGDLSNLLEAANNL